MMDAPSWRHTLPEGKKNLKGEEKYATLAQLAESSPGMEMLEDFLTGFISGSSYSGSAECQSSMEGIIHYGIVLIENREVYDPRQTMKAAIAVQKLQEQTSLFYA